LCFLSFREVLDGDGSEPVPEVRSDERIWSSDAHFGNLQIEALAEDENKQKDASEFVVHWMILAMFFGVWPCVEQLAEGLEEGFGFFKKK
jgi:hypothetical protein